MDRYAVVGNPVGHSLSPGIHAAFAAATGEPVSYTTVLAPLDGFAACVEVFFAEGGAGLNVTVPFKGVAADWVDELDPAAATARAVNTIARREDAFRGFNTDGAGLLRDLQGNCGVTLSGARILLLGAGGAARGVLGPLLQESPASLVIANRTAARARQLAEAFRGEANAAALSTAPLAEVGEGFDLVINATSAGLRDAVVPLSPRTAAGALCYDMVYAVPAGGTAFCRWAAAHGAAGTMDGLGMLVEQAALAFEIWRGVLPDTAPVLERLRRPV
ncbi:MAG: shikimate dehydrogenase [Gammaproteobacteria bacterium]|nr:shikimate dehydrogenase [Gammaproteobacteria bacterium]